MAVPKHRQSHARTNKRRFEHNIVPPGLAELPALQLQLRDAPRCLVAVLLSAWLSEKAGLESALPAHSARH